MATYQSTAVKILADAKRKAAIRAPSLGDLTETYENIKLGAKTEKYLREYISSLQIAPDLSALRTRYDKIARILAMTPKPKDGKKKTDACEDTAYTQEADEINLPIVSGETESYAAQLAGIFLADNPPIRMQSTPATYEIAAKYDNLFADYSARFQWRRNLLRVIQDAVKYNVGAAHIYFHKPAKTDSNAASALLNAQSLRNTSGVRIEHLNIFNVFRDMTVEISDVHRLGAYVGFVQAVTPAYLAMYCAERGISRPKHDTEDNTVLHIFPHKPFTAEDETVKDAKSRLFSDIGEDAEFPNGAHRYTLTTIYIRAVPSDVGIENPSILPSVFRIVICNGKHILHVDELKSVHKHFPIVLAGFREDSTGRGKTLAEALTPLQNIARALYNLDILSTRRAIVDRGIYDPRLVAEEHMNAESVVAKVPLKAGAVSGELRNAYLPFPYEDRALGSRIATANSLLGIANKISGLNAAAQGQFVKGNKTAEEFNTIMGNMDSRIRMSAISMDDAFFGPLREILISDVIQFQTDVKIRDMRTGETVEIRASDLVENRLNFKAVSGLTQGTTPATVSAVQIALQVAGSDPAFAQEFKKGKAIAYMLQAMGLHDMDLLLYTEAEKQQMQQAALQQAIAVQQAQQQNAQQQSVQQENA